MDLLIVIRNGPDQGVSFKIQHGLKLGRKGADFLVKDPAASSLHAIIRENAPGEFFLIDHKSKNGTKINGLREDVIPLTEGVVFHIGQTEFRVVKSLQPNVRVGSGSVVVDTLEPSQKMEILRAPPPPSASSGPPPQSSLIEVNVEYRWNDYLEEFSQQKLGKIKNVKKPILPLNPAVKLSFFRGLQTDTTWVLGYGPRTIGSHEYDLIIYEPEAPPICFEIHPTPRGPEFITSHPKTVLLNHQPCSKKVLAAGDVITINETHIRIDLIP